MLIAHSTLVVLALKDDCHKKRMDMLAYTPVELNYLETLAKTLIIPAWQNQFIQENIFNNAPVRRIAIAMNTNFAFGGSHTENPFWYQQFELRQIRILRGGEPFVDFHFAVNCSLYVTTMKAMNFQDDIPSIPIDNFKDHYKLVFDLTPMQDATDNCHYYSCHYYSSLLLIVSHYSSIGTMVHFPLIMFQFFGMRLLPF